MSARSGSNQAHCNRGRVVILVGSVGFILLIVTLIKAGTPKPTVQLELDASVAAVKAVIDTVGLLLENCLELSRGGG